MAQQPELPEIKLDAASLYREEIFTDRRAGTLRRMTPVTTDGAVDASRPVLFSGQTQLLTPGGVLPLGFDIEAATLQEALERFPDGLVTQEVAAIMAQNNTQPDRVAAESALIEAILAARRIAIYGAGREGLQMEGLAMRLFHLGLDVHVVGDMNVLMSVGGRGECDVGVDESL